MCSLQWLFLYQIQNGSLQADVAQAFDGEQALTDGSAAEQTGQAGAQQSDDGDQGIAEGMGVDHPMLRHTLRPGSADVVGVEYLQHVGAGIAQHAAQAGDDEHRDGKH